MEETDSLGGCGFSGSGNGALESVSSPYSSFPKYLKCVDCVALFGLPLCKKEDDVENGDWKVLGRTLELSSRAVLCWLVNWLIQVLQNHDDRRLFDILISGCSFLRSWFVFVLFLKSSKGQPRQRDQRDQDNITIYLRSTQSSIASLNILSISRKCRILQNSALSTDPSSASFPRDL